VKHIPFFAKIRDSKYMGFTIDPETNIKNRNYSTFRIEEMINRFHHDNMLEKINNAESPHRGEYLKMNLFWVLLILYTATCLIWIVHQILNQFTIPNNNLSSFYLNVFSDTIVTVIAFCLAAWKGEKILELMSEKRRLNEWKQVGKLCDLHLDKTLNELSSRIIFNSGLPKMPASTLFHLIGDCIAEYTKNDFEVVNPYRTKGLVGRFIFALPQNLQEIKSLETSLAIMIEMYSDALPTMLKRIFLETTFELNHLFNIVNIAGGFSPPPPWGAKVEIHSLEDGKVQFNGNYTPWDECSILKSLSRVFGLLSDFPENRRNAGMGR
jgi:hypothetical protein